METSRTQKDVTLGSTATDQRAGAGILGAQPGQQVKHYDSAENTSWLVARGIMKEGANWAEDGDPDNEEEPSDPFRFGD